MSMPLTFSLSLARNYMQDRLYNKSLFSYSSWTPVYRHIRMQYMQCILFWCSCPMDLCSHTQTSHTSYCNRYTSHSLILYLFHVGVWCDDNLHSLLWLQLFDVPSSILQLPSNTTSTSRLSSTQTATTFTSDTLHCDWACDTIVFLCFCVRDFPWVRLWNMFTAVLACVCSSSCMRNLTFWYSFILWNKAILIQLLRWMWLFGCGYYILSHSICNPQTMNRS